MRKIKFAVDIDGNWKRLIEAAADDFLAFFFPVIFRLLDLTRKIEFLEQEMQNIKRGTKKGRLFVDKLLKVPLKDGRFANVVVHIEIQGKAEKGFSERMFIYDVLGFVKMKLFIDAIAIFVGNKVPSNAGVFDYSGIENKNLYRYKTYHIFQQSEEVLLKKNNIFALAILINRYMLETDISSEKRLILLKKIVLLAKKRKYSFVKMVEILSFAVEMLKIDNDLEADFKNFIVDENLEEVMGTVVSKRTPRYGMLNLYHSIEFGVSYEEYLAQSKAKELEQAEALKAKELEQAEALKAKELEQAEALKAKDEEKERQFRATVVKLSEKFNMTVQQIADVHETELERIEQILKEEAEKKNQKK